MNYQTVPNDLEIVSEYVREQIIQNTTVPATVTQPKQDVEMIESNANPDFISTELENPDVIDIKLEEEAITNPDSIDIKLEEEENTADPDPNEIKLGNEEQPEQDQVVKTEDALDAAIAGKVTNYNDSDVSLSSSDDDSSESEQEDEADASDAENISDEEGDGPENGIVKTAHEIVEFHINTPSFVMTPQTAIVLAGEVFQIVDNVVVVQSRPGSEFTTLDQGSLLVYENREIMGEVFETFGPVSRPFYTVRFKSQNDINKELCQVKSLLFYVPDYKDTQFVQTEALKKIKGTDASNMYDEEPAEHEMEFSDDEEEKEYKKKLKREKKARKQVTMNQPAYAARDATGDIDMYNSMASAIPPRRQQSYADMYDDFGADLDSYQQQQQQRQPQPQPQPQPELQPQPQMVSSASHVAASLLGSTSPKPTPSPKPVGSSLFGNLPSTDDIESNKLE